MSLFFTLLNFCWWLWPLPNECQDYIIISVSLQVAVTSDESLLPHFIVVCAIHTLPNALIVMRKQIRLREIVTNIAAAILVWILTKVCLTFHVIEWGIPNRIHSISLYHVYHSISHFSQPPKLKDQCDKMAFKNEFISYDIENVWYFIRRL